PADRGRLRYPAANGRQRVSPQQQPMATSDDAPRSGRLADRRPDLSRHAEDDQARYTIAPAAGRPGPKPSPVPAICGIIPHMTTELPALSAFGHSPYPPIGDYGFLSDCESTALVAPSGNVEWMCLPRMDSPSVFGSILDRDAGGFRLGPADVAVPAARRYLPGTMVLETSWGTPTGWIIVRDVLLIGPWHHEKELSQSHRRAPTDYDAEHVLLRTVRCVNGEV